MAIFGSLPAGTGIQTHNQSGHYLRYWNLHLSIKYYLAPLVASTLGDLSEVTKATAVIKTTWARVCTSFRVCSNLFFIFSRLSDRRFPVFEAFFHDIRRLRDLQEFVSTRLSKTQVQVRRVWLPYVDVCVTMPGATNWLQRRLPAKKRLALGKLLFW